MCVKFCLKILVTISETSGEGDKIVSLTLNVRLPPKRAFSHHMICS